jgi:hypothetical protein
MPRPVFAGAELRRKYAGQHSKNGDHAKSQRALRAVEARDVENVVNAPPLLVASSRTTPFSIRRDYNDNAVKTLTIGVNRYVVNVFRRSGQYRSLSDRLVPISITDAVH